MWYTVSVFLQGVHEGNRPVDDLWEERIILLDASDESEAGAAARTLAESESVEFAAVTGHRVKWRFSHVGQVYSIDAPGLQSGVEVFSRFLRDSEARSLSRPFEAS
jgi:hypothetical protein